MVDSTLTSLNLIMTVGSFFIAVVGMFLLIFGYINLRRAHKIVDDRIKGKLDSLKYDFAIEFNKLQESTHKMIAGYENHSKGNIDTAIELYKSAIEIFPKTFNGYPSLGYAYLEKNNKADALLSFSKAVELFPDKISSYNDLARVHALLNNREGCIQNIKEMAFRDIDSIKFLLNDTVITNIVSELDIRAIYNATIGTFGP
jgi:tetratricopeptide (TPR) repeat protein